MFDIYREADRLRRLSMPPHLYIDAVSGLVEIESGVVFGVMNLASSSVGALHRTPHHEKAYHEV